MVATMGKMAGGRAGGRQAKALGSERGRRRMLVDGSGGGGGKANLRVNMNGGPEADLRPTADPFDRAHNVHLGAYLACAADPKTGAPSRNLVARPRRYHESNLVAELRAGGVTMGRVGVDSAADGLADRLDWIALRFGVDLLRGGRVMTAQWGREVLGQQVRIRDLVEQSRKHDWRLARSRRTFEGRHERMVEEFLKRRQGEGPEKRAGDGKKMHAPNRP